MPVPTSITSAGFEHLDLVLASGSWPDDLSGEMLISAPQTSPDLPSALFGFGVMCRLSLRPGTHGSAADRFAWRTNRIDSPSARLYDKVSDQFQAGPTGYGSALGFPNQANTAPLPWGDRLFAAWDVGRPIEIDPLGLNFLGEVGHRRGWGDATVPIETVLPFFFSTAHPVIDPERDCLWTVKLTFDPGGGMALHVVHWPGTGTEVRSWPVQDGIVFGSSHSVSQTRDYLVLADSGNFKTDPAEMAGGERTVTIDTDAAVYLIRKDELLATPVGAAIVPTACRVAPTTGHFFGCWDDDDGVRIIFEHMDLMDLGYKVEPDDLDANGEPIDPGLVGFYNTAMAPNSCSEVVFDPQTGTSRQMALFRDELTFNLELSAMDWSTEGLLAPTMHHIAYQGFRPGAVVQRALHRYGERVPALPREDTPGRLVSLRRGSLEVAAEYFYDDVGDHVTSPTFVPRQPNGRDRQQAGGPDISRYAGDAPGGHDGYVVLPVLSDDGFRVDVFDAARVGDGPLATLRSPDRECVPLLLHAAWMPAVGSTPDDDRLRFADDVAGGVIDGLDDDLAAVVRSVAAELDRDLLP